MAVPEAPEHMVSTKYLDYIRLCIVFTAVVLTFVSYFLNPTETGFYLLLASLLVSWLHGYVCGKLHRRQMEEKLRSLRGMLAARTRDAAVRQ